MNCDCVWEINPVIDEFLFPEIENDGENLLEDCWGSPLLNQWSLFKVNFSKAYGKKKADLHFLLGYIPLISEKTRSLFNFNDSDVELLPVFDESGSKYYIVNPCFCDSHILNEQKSKITYNPEGKISWISEPVFLHNSEKLLFMIPRMPTKIYVNETFVNIVKEHKLQGIDFITRKIKGPSIFHKFIANLRGSSTLLLLSILIASCAGSREEDKNQNEQASNEFQIQDKPSASDMQNAPEDTLVQKETFAEHSLDTITKDSQKEYQLRFSNIVDTTTAKALRKRKVKPAFIIANIDPFSEESIIRVNLSLNSFIAFNKLFEGVDSQDPIVLDKYIIELFKKNMNSEIHDARDSLFAIPQYYHVAATKLIDDGNENGVELYKQAIEGYETFLANYSNEPNWDVYLAHTNLAFAYHKAGKYEKSAKMFDWIANIDTTEYGERPINLTYVLSPEKAAYNAVLMMDFVREQAQKQFANNDPVKAYELPETKAYFEQVEKYLAKFGDCDKALVVAFNSAVVHYDAKQFELATTILQNLIKKFPEHEQIPYVRNLLALTLCDSNQFSDLWNEYEWLYNYSKNNKNRNDSIMTAIKNTITYLRLLIQEHTQKGTFTDTRDGQTYKTVQIGNQTWMAQNLNYKTGKSSCYNNNKKDCEKYGRLYDWNTAMKACPEGWHLPSREEYEQLLFIACGKYICNKELNSKTGWLHSDNNDEDKLGFSALPAGYYGDHQFFGGGKKFRSLGTGANFWTSSTSEYDETSAEFMDIDAANVYEASRSNLWAFEKNNLASIRCVKNMNDNTPSRYGAQSAGYENAKSAHSYGIYHSQHEHLKK
ncbi:fibrobacter succinogenes major paralogous domain-containing protein [Fibrobacter sp. UWB7]|uniref:fibrobacter succinogenes major paralogous domain-containing protein n=1 Tax=Fibrobacter sp. UWB7 TaxID=1896206 RepID=UPI000917B427|nr:fibrobacter succinogenes major paralogous domain-containing protein [Fibrobacter sp. UWB7]SHM14177.1 major paralogous domain-containing protein [Fibrobacter sp. UWB7]